MTDRATRQMRVRDPVEAEYDAVVIGAGVGGLTAAALLARAGKSVLILDQHYVPGGNSTVFRRKDWLFDVGMHYIGDCHAGGGLPRILKQCGVEDVVFRPMDDDFEEMHFPDFVFHYSRDVNVFRQRLVELFPDEVRGIDRYLKLLGQVGKLSQLNGPNAKLNLAKTIAKAPLLTSYALRPLGDFLDTCTKDERLRAVLVAQNGTYAMAPTRIATAVHLALQSHYFLSGGWYPEGGGQQMSDRLAESIEAAGGHLRLRSEVTELLVENGRAAGVRFTNKHLGEVEVRSRVVISNMDVKRLVRDVMPTGSYPTKQARQIADFKMALPLIVVFIGLDIPVEDLPYGNQNVWLFDGYNFDTFYDKTQNGHADLTERPFIYVSTASSKDPHNKELAPDGHTNLELMTITPSDPAYWGVTDAQIADGSYADSEVYQARKAEWTEACIRQFERIVPGVREHIVYQEACSPFTHVRYVRSTGGTSYGFSMEPSQFFKRPSVKAPLDGLYICGANGALGHGIGGSMASGKVAGKLATRELSAG